MKPLLNERPTAPAGSAASALLAKILGESRETAVLGLDDHDGVVLCNPGACRLYGVEADEVAGSAAADLILPAHDLARERLEEILAAARRDGVWEGTLRQRSRHGRPAEVDTEVVARKEAEGGAGGLLFIQRGRGDERPIGEGLRGTRLFDSAIVGTT